MALNFTPAKAGCPDDNVTFGGSLAAAPANAEDNDTFIVTDTGDFTGQATEVYKYDIESGQWVSIDLDTDISALAFALSGTVLSVSVTEDGVTLTDDVDLAAFLDDTDVSDVEIVAGPNSTATNPTILVNVEEDGVVVASNEYALPIPPDTDVTAVTLRAGPNDTDKRPTVEVVVTEDGNDVVSNEWPLATICPDEMTRAQLLALRNAGELCKDCHYVITDPGANGTLRLEKVLMHAVDENTLSGCYLKVAHDNTAWNGAYDIDTNQVRQVFDHLYDNEVSGNTAVTTFPWGVAAVTDSHVTEGRLNYTAGQVRGVTIGHNSTVNMIDGILRESTITQDSDLTVRSGDNFSLEVSGESNLNQVGTGYMRRTTVTNESNVTLGDTPMNDNRFERAQVNTTGSSGAFNYNRLHATSLQAQNVPTFNVIWNTFAANSQVAANGAARFDVRYGTFSGYARLLVSAGRSLSSQYDGIRDYGYIQVLNGFLTSRYNSISNVGYVQHNTPGSNAVDSNKVTSRARIRFLATSNNCRVYYSTSSDGSAIEHRGSSTGCYIYYSDARSISSVYTNNSVNARMYYNTASGNSEIQTTGITGTHYVYYCGCTAHGYIRFDQGSAGRIYAVHCHGQGLLRFRPSGDGRIYYSSFTAYYYLYANAKTGTTTSLHGYGRRTRTTTGAITNGTPVENF